MINQILQIIAKTFMLDPKEVEADYYNLNIKSIDKTIELCDIRAKKRVPATRALLHLAQGENVIIYGKNANKVAQEMYNISFDPMIIGREITSLKAKSVGIPKAILCVIDADLRGLKYFHTTNRICFCTETEPDKELNEYFTIVNI